MAATINNFISALHSPRDAFKSLGDALFERDTNDKIAVCRTKHFADVRMVWRSKCYLLSLPISSEGLSMAQHAAVKMRTLSSKLLLPYRILPLEMSYLDSQSRLCSTDVVLEELPQGDLLSRCVGEVESSLLLGAIDNMEREFKRLKLTHSNLKPENIIVSPDYQLHPMRMHYLSLGEECRDDFDSLRRFVVGNADFVTPTDESGVYVEAAELKNAMYSYSHVGNPFEGMCVAEGACGYGYISPEGEEIISPRFVWAGDMREGRAEVETAEGMGLIDARGNYIIEPRYQIIDFDPRTGVSRAKQNDEWTTFDYEGRPLEVVVK